MDYGAAGAWDELAKRLARVHVPEPAGGGRVVCEPGWAWHSSPPDYDLWLVLAGRGRGTLNGEDFALRTGTLFLFRPGDSGYFQQDPEDRLTVVYCHFDFVHPVTRRHVPVPSAWVPSSHIPVSNVATLSELLQRVLRLSRDPHPIRQLESTAVFQAALIEVYVQDARALGHAVPHVDTRLQDVVEFVRAQPRRRPSLEEAAAVAGLSPSHLSRLFSVQIGTSFRAFVLQARLERAYSLLSETTMTVTEVAKALGYPDIYLFSRQFRRRYGQSPSKVRRT